MEKTESNRIIICMGSSCFSRGNNKNLEIVENFLKKHNFNTTVELAGNLCEEKCSKGPNITINNVLYSKLEPNSLLDILNRVFINPREKNLK